MRIWNVIKGSIKAIFYQLPVAIIAYGVFPLVLAFYATSGQDMTMPSLIRVEVIDEDETLLSVKFKELFEQEPFEWVTDNPSYQIIIPQGYEASILNQDELTININVGWEAQNWEFLVRLAIEDYHQQLGDLLWIEGTQPEALMVEQFKVISEAEIFEFNDYPLEERLAPFEQQLVATSSFVFFLSLSNLGMSTYLVKKMGVATRLQLIPLTKVQSYHLQILESFLFILAMLAISWLTIAIFSSQIFRSLIRFIPIIGLITVMGVSFVHLICEFLPELLGKGIFFSLSLFAISFTDINLGSFLKLERIWPGMIVQQLYIGALTNQWADFRFYSVRIGGFFLLTYCLMRIKIWQKWGRQ